MKFTDAQFAVLTTATASTYGEPTTPAEIVAAFVFENPLRPILLAVLAAELVIVVMLKVGA